MLQVPTSASRRSESIVPQQALALANSKLSLTMAREIATQLVSKLPSASANIQSVLMRQRRPVRRRISLRLHSIVF